MCSYAKPNTQAQKTESRLGYQTDNWHSVVHENTFGKGTLLLHTTQEAFLDGHITFLGDLPEGIFLLLFSQTSRASTSSKFALGVHSVGSTSYP